MKSLFDPQNYSEITERFAKLSQTSERKWGKMTVGQMVNHCQFPLKVALKEGELKKQFMPFAFLFKKSLYNDKPYRKNLPTANGFKVREEKNLETERKILMELVEAFHEKKAQTEWTNHPIFGKFTAQQWGQMQYKHLDHHLQQFGV